MTNSVTTTIRSWLVLAITTTIIFLGVYGAVQQSYRTGANDPQIQLAEDIAQALDQGVSIQKLVPDTKIDIATSLAPFITITDLQGKVRASSGLLDGQAPIPPQGTLDYAKTQGQNRLSWQPRPDVRSAIVIQPYSQGWVIAGRALREVEKRESNLANELLLGWLGTMFISLAVSLVTRKK